MKQKKKNRKIGCLGVIAFFIILGLFMKLPRSIQIIVGFWGSAFLIYYFAKNRQKNKNSSEQIPQSPTATPQQPKINSASIANSLSVSKKIFDFIVIDFETANEKRNSACSIGISAVKDLSIVAEKTWLIKPPTNEFKNINVHIHGITAEMVKNAPDFKSLWNRQIKHYINHSSFVVAHNASFDINVMKSCFQHYSISPNNFIYFDSIELLRRFEPLQRYGLKNAAEHFNIIMKKHHDAQSDATTAAMIVIEILKRNHFENIFAVESECPTLFHSFLNYNISYYKTIKKEKHQKVKSKDQVFHEFYTNIAVNYDALVYPSAIDASMPLYKKSFCFTGVLNVSRQDAIQSVLNRGGTFRKSAVKTLDYLVVGDQSKDVVGESGHSSKERKAIEHNKNGAHIMIIHESDFLKLLQ